MIIDLLSLLGWTRQPFLLIDFAPAWTIRPGRISGVRAAKRQAQKRRNRRRARHA